ncbi:MAG TPA: hypothetical protein VFR39_02115 [Burkholderiales bacterium]|nr:hypothetical protein [Burkholderiales bacterium]
MTRLESILAKYEGPICALLVLAVFAPYWPGDVLPYHDSILKYQFFHFAYSEVFLSGELPMWVPYGSYGVAAAIYQLTTLTPANYLVGAAGIVAGASDTLLLFKISVFLEVALYVSGLLVLARSIYERALSRLWVIFGGICSLSWLFQPYLNFHVFYLYPWLLLCLFSFLRSGDPGKLWLAAAVGLFSLIGTASYFASLHLFVLTVLCGMAFVAGARPPLVRELRRWIFCWQAGVAAALAAILAASAWLGVQEIVTAAPGRDASSLRVPLSTFLDYGRMTKLTVANGYLSGSVTHADNTYYIGLLPLVLVLSALLWLGHSLFLGVAAAALGLIWLSFGGWFSSLAYFFPAMSLFRHIGLTYGLSGLLLIVASGWVVDVWLRRFDSAGQTQPGPLRYQRLVIVAVMGLMAVDLLASWRQDDGVLIPLHHEPLLSYMFPARVLVYLAAIAAALALWKKPGSSAAGSSRILAPLMAAYVFDIGSYQASVLLTLPRVETAITTRAFAPDALPYHSSRDSVNTGDSTARWKFALLEGRTTYLGTYYANSAAYAFGYTFMGVDPCYPRVRSDIWQRGVYDALIARGARLPQKPPGDFLPVDDPRFKAALGCGAPKLGVVGEYLAAHSGDTARDLLKSALDPSGTPVMETAAAGTRSSTRSSGAIGDARVTGFSANRVEIDVVNNREQPVWMYYADAFHSHWQARVDGVGTPVVRANAGFKAVSIPPGRHSVSLTFGEGVRQIVSWLLAAVGGAACLAGLIAAAVMATRRDGARARQESSR